MIMRYVSFNIKKHLLCNFDGMLVSGFGSNDSYTFHMHGHGMQVVATGQRHDGSPLSKDQFLRINQENKIARSDSTC